MATNAAASTPRAVGLYLAGVQWLFALGWIVYAIYLPRLAQQAGLPGEWVPRLLLLDQIVFLVTDLAVGLWSDRAAAVHGRIARVVVAATAVSTAAFLLLPWVAQAGSPALLVAVTLVWAVTSSALRAPPLTLLGRYVARPAQPAMVALSALGLGLAQAASPYLGLQLKSADPRWPFLVSGLALAALTLGMVAAERSLARGAEPRRAAAPPPALGAAAITFAAACLTGAAGFQFHVFLASAPLYLRHAAPAELPFLLPVFWVGFNVALWPASGLVRRIGPPTAMAVGAALSAFGVAGAAAAPGLAAAVTAQAVAGLGWAVLLCGAFAAALHLGATGREGLLSGLLQSALAGAAAVRLLVVVWLAPGAAAVTAWAGLPAAAFAAAALMLAVRARAAHTPEAAPRSTCRR